MQNAVTMKKTKKDEGRVTALWKRSRNLFLDQNYGLKKAFHRCRITRRIPDQEQGFLWIYSVGKAGTSSLYQSLVSRPDVVPCYQFHFMNPDNLDAFERWELETFPWSKAIHEHAILGRHFKAVRDGGLDLQKLKIITAFRDPVAGHLSGFFENLYMETRIPFKRLAAWDDQTALRKLTESFYARCLSGDGLKTFERRLQWFDQELKSVFGVDVYETDFPKERGYAVYSRKHPHTLVLKMEAMDRAVEPAMREFLGLESFSLQKANVGEQKRYSRIYRLFLKSITLPESFLDKAYSSRLVRHFYTEEEIAGFRGKWSRGEAKETVAPGKDLDDAPTR